MQMSVWWYGSLKGSLILPFNYRCVAGVQECLMKRTIARGLTRISNLRHKSAFARSATKVNTSNYDDCESNNLPNNQPNQEIVNNNARNGVRYVYKIPGLINKDIDKRIQDTPIIHIAQAESMYVLQHNNLNDVSSSDTEFTITDKYLLACTRRIMNKSQSELKSCAEEVADNSVNSQNNLEVVKPVTGAWRSQQFHINKLPGIYASLAKSRLTGLVVLTSMAGYALAPGPLVPLTLAYCTIGTALVSASANTINQLFEVPYDSQMDRTKNRVLVTGLITPLHAVTFGAVCGLSGVALLSFGVSPISGVLGAANVLLYTSIYTPLKRLSIYNTWVGAIVGAIPPMMGWAGCTGGLEAGAWILGGILFAWQFPHFNALSWNLRKDYSRAGYRMMCVVNPELCRRTSLQYSLAMIGLCAAAPAFGVTTWFFSAYSLPINLYLSYLAWRFYNNSDSKNSRKLFRFSLIHLPAILILMIITKNYHSKEKVSSVESKQAATSQSISSINIQPNVNNSNFIKVS